MVETRIDWSQYLHNFSPTATALGSSAIVKVSGQNCFRTRYGSLGQIHLGLPKGSVEGLVSLHRGFTTVPPRLRKFRGVSGADTSWLPSVSWICGRFTRLRKFRDHSGLLEAKRSCGKFPITSLNLSRSSSTLFRIFLTALALGTSAIVKVLGQNDTFVFRGSLQQMPFASQKVLWSVPHLHLSHSLLRFFWQMAVAPEKVLWKVPPTILYICLPNGCCFIKALWRFPPTVLYIYLPVSLWGESCVNCWHVSPIQIQSAENDCRCCWGILWAYQI